MAEYRSRYTGREIDDAVGKSLAIGNIDGSTAKKDDEGNLKIIGVVDSKTGEIDKFWTGTLEEYNQIEVKDPNTIYNITDARGGGSVEVEMWYEEEVESWK